MRGKEWEKEDSASPLLHSVVMAAQTAMDAELAIKCLVVGDAGIGKTSFVKR